jgi:hypothetical protein
MCVLLVEDNRRSHTFTEIVSLSSQHVRRVSAFICNLKITESLKSTKIADSAAMHLLVR